jgi:LacI family transcriptional regulator
MTVSDDTGSSTGRVTIRDVARAAGVSRQTVTRAINEMADISAETRERVMKTVRELGYRPNRFAIDLSRQRTHAVGLLVGSFRNPYYAQLADSFIVELQKRDWQVVIGTAGPDEAAAIRSMAAQTDAIIGYFLKSQNQTVAAAQGLPIVLLEERATLAGLHSVEFDIREGILQLVAELRARGARRFAMIDAANDYPDALLGSPRRRFFEEAVGSQCLVATQPESIAGGMVGFRDLLTQDPDIDTILTFNDLMAMGAVQGSHVMGISVPGAVRIVGIDGLSLGEATSPTLTTLSLQSDVVAAEAGAGRAHVFAADIRPSESITRTVSPVVLWRESA